MEIGRKIRELSARKIHQILREHHRYTDFNRLGLFRGILESEKLTLEQKQSLKEAAVAAFPKYYDFLILKDPDTWDQLEHLGQERLQPELRRDWQDIRRRQKSMLREKRLRHRNFGVYSKHLCGYDHCRYNGSMVKAKHSPRYGYEMHFDSDHRRSPHFLAEKEVRRKRAKRARQWLTDWREEDQP
ncbi:hypothetical protein [Lewinella sp. W8]|uniref:hypothetical protein n=1 Tax=Lewinella sp. W8 TaxID=2528208 RepID=UPI00106746C1|nr:hypothetical protein [Lewinella sp. W8]MTB50192.1 hypothetical protein [Lewinella sp. W8]